MKKRMVCGWMAAALAAWTLHAAAEPPKLTAIEFQFSPESVTVSGTGQAGTTYKLNWSEHLGTNANWKQAATATAKGDGSFTALDQTYRKPGFYRVETMVSHKGVQLWEGGPEWAETNVGADSPEDYGLYFWWGDTLGYRWENDAWVASNGSVDDYEFSEETTPTYGKEAVTLLNEKWITEGGILSLNHDAARVHWGEGWRMPTDEDIDALVEKCDWTWTTKNGVAGYVVRGKGDFEEASIFIPAAGYGFGTWLAYAGSRGFVWSSVPDASYSDYAWRLYFDSDTHSVSSGGRRSRGRSVRPVRDSAE